MQLKQGFAFKDFNIYIQ